MARGKGKVKEQNPFSVVLDFVDIADTIFAKLTGKTIAAWLKEFQQHPGELPSGGQAAPPQEPAMSLDDAYSVLGLPKTASLEEVKRNYRQLALIFHPDKGGYEEAMKLLNNAYHTIIREKKGE